MRSSRIALVLILPLTLLLFACGGSGTKLAPPATGSFTNANLSGTYAFSVSGTNQAGFLALAGSLQADGNGTFTSGVMDVNSGTGVFSNLPASGNYSVGADGRGIATINSSAGTFTIDFVIVSSSRALASRFDVNSSASGSFDKQDSTAFSASAITGQYAFSLSGIGANGGTYQTAGLFTANGSGLLSNGLQDINNDGSVTAAAPATGVYTVGVSNGRGTLALSTSNGTLSFVFYVVDATHIKLIETDSVPVVAGDAYRQSGTFSNAALTGPFSFTVGGGLSGPAVAGGVFNADGSGSITNGVADINNSGSVTQNASSTGTYGIASTGRGTLTLTNSAGTLNFAIYPTTGGLLMLDLDSSFPVSGTAFAQGATPSASSVTGNYGYNLTGVSLTSAVELDSIARVAGDGNGNFTGAVDLNIGGSLSQSLAFTGPYTMSSNGRGTATLKSSAGTQTLALYFVSGSRILFVDLDSGVVGVGDFETQQ